MISAAHSKPTLKKLQRVVIHRVATKWYELGIELLEEGQEGQLKVIEESLKNDAKKCLEMFDYWLGKTPNANWYNIVEALKSPAVDLATVAFDVESAFVSHGEYKVCRDHVYSHISVHVQLSRPAQHSGPD